MAYQPALWRSSEEAIVLPGATAYSEPPKAPSHEDRHGQPSILALRVEYVFSLPPSKLSVDKSQHCPTAIL